MQNANSRSLTVYLIRAIVVIGMFVAGGQSKHHNTQIQSMLIILKTYILFFFWCDEHPQLYIV